MCLCVSGYIDRGSVLVAMYVDKVCWWTWPCDGDPSEPCDHDVHGRLAPLVAFHLEDVVLLYG